LTVEPTSLPQRLKAATLEMHQRAERSGVMAGLLGGRLSFHGYVLLTQQMHALYTALESALVASPGPFASVQSLARTTSLAADLHAMRADGAAPWLAPALHTYVQRLAEARQAQAHRLWAHVYVRYLGDLHGGQILARRVRSLYALPNGQGTDFYDFGTEQQVLAARAALRADLAGLRLTPGQADEVVAEAVWGFEAHCNLFDQLQDRLDSSDRRLSSQD
jgi:heme oxygenase